MKLLLTSTDAPYLHHLQSRLEACGIPAFVSDENTAGVLPTGSLIEMGLWVHLDEHYEDAQALLEDPGHEVAHPLWPDPASGSTSHRELGRTLRHLGLFVTLICLGLFLLAWLLHHLPGLL